MELGWIHLLSIPYRHESNAVAERSIGVVKGGARSTLLGAGLPPKWWPLATRHFCFSLNINKFGDETVSPWQLRHGGHDFDGLRIAFGALCEFRPVQPKLDRMPEFAPRAVEGIFLGYVLIPGERWKGDYLVADLADFRAGKKSIHVQQVREVIEVDSIEFPLFEAKQKADREININKIDDISPDESYLIDIDGEEDPPPSVWRL